MDEKPPDSTASLPLDQVFDDALAHLSTCRIAYEEDPRSPETIRSLGLARIALEQARADMINERVRLGLEPRALYLPPASKIDADPHAGWQAITGDG